VSLFADNLVLGTTGETGEERVSNCLKEEIFDELSQKKWHFQFIKGKILIGKNREDDQLELLLSEICYGKGDITLEF